jgi:hypothetical protein
MHLALAINNSRFGAIAINNSRFGIIEIDNSHFGTSISVDSARRTGLGEEAGSRSQGKKNYDGDAEMVW